LKKGGKFKMIWSSWRERRFSSSLNVVGRYSIH
jgi:hypothetical protein